MHTHTSNHPKDLENHRKPNQTVCIRTMEEKNSMAATHDGTMFHEIRSPHNGAKGHSTRIGGEQVHSVEQGMPGRRPAGRW